MACRGRNELTCAERVLSRFYLTSLLLFFKLEKDTKLHRVRFIEIIELLYLFLYNLFNSLLQNIT